MDKTLLIGTVGSALARAGDTGSAMGHRVAKGVSAIEWHRLVPEARNMFSTGAKLALARQGLRVVTTTTRRHPVVVAAAATALAGLGVAYWLTRRHRAEVIEAEATRKPARKRSTAKKSTARKSASKATASKPAAKKSSPRKSAARKSASKSAGGASASTNSAQPSA